MPQPPAYNRQKDFTSNFGHETDHSALNGELDKAGNSINDIRTNLAILQADDGKLNPDVITADSISAPVRNELSLSIVGQVQGSVDAAAASASAASGSATTAIAMRDQTSGFATAASGSAANAAASAASVDAANIVHRTGNEAADGVKTFTSSPVVPDLGDGDSTGKVANTKYAKRAAQLAVEALKLPAIAVGVALNFLRVKADGSGYEHRTIAQVRAELRDPYVYIRDEKPYPEEGGIAVGVTWNVRVLNTKVNDSGNHASLAGNSITLTSGTWRVAARAPACRVDAHKARLRNVTTGITLVDGANAVSSDATSDPTTDAVLRGEFTVGENQSLQLQHWIKSGGSLNDLGGAVNIDASEKNIYSEIEFWKVG